MDHACMARFAEPVFACSASSFEIFHGFPGQASDDDLVDGLEQYADAVQDTRQNTVGMSDQTSSGIFNNVHQQEQHLDSNHSNDGAITTQDFHTEPTPRSCDPPLHSDDSFQSEDERRRRLVTEVNNTNGLRHFDMRSDPLAQPRTASHHPSCDNLRTLAFTPDSSQPVLLRTAASQADLANQRDSSLEISGLQHGSAAQYTVLTDMAETAWSVDDPRYGADVLDSLSAWNAAGSPSKLRETLGERCAANEGALPFLNREDMLESGFDIQGIAWRGLEVSRQEVLSHRANIHNPFSSLAVGDDEFKFPERSNEVERHYRFHSYSGLIRPKFSHYQLRHVLASNGRDIFYTTSSKVMRTALSCASTEDTVLDLTKSTMTSTPIRITCLAASDSVIIAGGFDGEYAISNLDFTSPPSSGYVTHDLNGLVTHIHTFSHRRSGLAQAAFTANDQRLRLMDLTTQTFTKVLPYDNSLNAAATASDGRLRALAGDSPTALITDAETGESLAELHAHTDHIFACAWSPDDRLVATGAQDGKIALWDSRYWARPLAELPSALSCSRSLHFTADSSLLVSAENEDVVSVFDTRGLGPEQQQQQYRQDVRFLGTVAGVAMVEGGDEIVIANGDRSVGGLMSLQRVGGRRTGFEDGSVPRCGRRRRGMR
ncbi:hypothetical protein Q7P37_001759 [Cladosporium fusiforme]